jgi:hypothetical protein
MIRRSFRLLSGLSLLLCVATCVLWARSYSYCEGGPVFLSNMVAGVEKAADPGSKLHLDAGDGVQASPRPTAPSGERAAGRR